jgi:glutamate formiminotransferase
VLSCAINCSEGRDELVLAELARAAGGALLDLHADPWHHRCVLTLGGSSAAVGTAARRVAAAAVERIDLRRHRGVHPRLGVVDVVPFTPLPAYEASAADGPLRPAPLDEALRARSAFCAWAGEELGIACFFYGPERALPDVRRGAFGVLGPHCGPRPPDPARGACCVGARDALVAYNIVLAGGDLPLARRVATVVRSPVLRTLGLPTGNEVQVSCNLVAPHVLGPAEAVDLVAARVPVARTELVGLLPAAVLARVPPARWGELDLSSEHTIEWRVAHAHRGGAGETSEPAGPPHEAGAMAPAAARGRHAAGVGPERIGTAPAPGAGAAASEAGPRAPRAGQPFTAGP